MRHDETPQDRRKLAQREEAVELWEAAQDLHAEVEMGEAVGICLESRAPSLRVGAALARLNGAK